MVDEQELILRSMQGDVSSFGLLVQSYQSSVFNACYRLTGDRHEAEDLAQEAFFRAYQRMNTFNTTLPFGPWIRRIATNLSINQLEKKKAPVVSVDEDRDQTPDDLQKSPETTLEEAQTSREIRNALLELPLQYRLVIELRHYQDLSYEEISTTLQIPISDVKSHLFRARKILAEKLKAYEQ